MSKKPKDTDDDYVDPDLAAQAELQKKYEAEALADDKTAQPEGYGVPAEMPQRFLTGGATADEKAVWVAENGGCDPTQPTGEVAPGDAAPKAEEDVPPQ